MAEGFESYHVPQQRRRDKLRVVAHNHPDQCVETLQGCAGLLPLYDPSLLPSDFISCANFQSNKSNPNRTSACESIKEESHLNLMNLYMDPQQQSSIQLNPSSIQDHINSNPFLFASQNLRLFDESFNNNGEVVHKPEPLSLSLSSNQTHQQTSLPLELNLQRYENSSIYNVVPSAIIGGIVSSSLSRSSVPAGPFTGYGSILKGSRFLKPAQLLLEEICDVGRGIYAENMMADSGLMDPWMENLSYSGFVDESVSGADGGEELRKKSRLISMLNEVYRRYKYYYQQMQAVVASFESVAGLGNAAPYANLALKAMSKHFRNLKNAITDQLQFTNKSQNFRKDETPRFGNSDNIYSQRTVNNSGFHDQPVWRPQRGLPERAVTVLRSWLFEHFLHPYPTDTDKLMLAKQTGLSRNQVSNWFINARVRLWKPMVEEIHMLETRQSKKALQREELNTDRPNDHLPTPTSLASENPSFKRTRNDFDDIPVGSTEDTMGLSYAHLSHHQHVGVGTSNTGGSGGVSLTLGLHQNNGIGLSEPFPINAARRFGLDSNSGEYAFGSFENQNRQFGRDFIGGQLLHDFVG